MILKKIANKIRSGYWKVVSKSKKKAFENNKVDVYQYKDDFFCSNIETLENLKRANSRKDYWKEQETYSIKKIFLKHMQKLIVCCSIVLFLCLMKNLICWILAVQVESGL